MRRLLSIISISALLLWACNKNSTELAPISSSPKTLVKDGTLDGKVLVEANFSQYNSSLHDSVYVSFSNNYGSDLTNLRVIVEFCKALPQSYDNCNLQYDTTIASLPTGRTTSMKMVLADKHLRLVDSSINVYIVSCDQAAAHNPLAGSYSDSIVAFRQGTAIVNYAFCNGYIQPDGLAAFRIKVSDSASYNISQARFSDIAAFNGKLLSNGGINALLTLDTVSVNASNNKIFTLRLSKKLSDSTDNISFNLKSK